MTDENALAGQPGEMKMTVHVTRKATGKVETFELTGTPVIVPDEPEKEKDAS